MTIRHKIETVLGLSLILILLVFVLINRETTEADFLFGTVEVSRALLFLGFFFSGLTVGWVAHSFMRRRKRRNKSQPDQEEEADA
ncbi:MAG: LapA family protein [Verrucomicrobiales bacterium]|nr:LapA family protein [Verrucomicrobiales bacterium]